MSKAEKRHFGNSGQIYQEEAKTASSGKSESSPHSDTIRISKLFEKCHDVIWDGGRNDPAFAFNEFSKILTVKFLDERENAGERVFSSPKKIKKFYADTVKRTNGYVFDAKISLSDGALDEIIGLIGDTDISKIDLDVKGQAMEVFLGKMFRGEYSQYFTPRNVVRFCVSVLDPQKNDTIMDPCCGSGGFLIYSMMYLLEKYPQINPAKNLFGIEINKSIATIAKMEMMLREDWTSNITCKNSLDFKHGKKYAKIFTNPPFGVTVTDKAILSEFDLGSYGQSEILFIEKCHDLLSDMGKMCIVLPDSILTNSQLERVRQYILDNFKILGMVSLPQHAFIHSGAGVKSSLLFLQKQKTRRNYKIFIGVAKHIGYDSRYNEDANDLPNILQAWKNDTITEHSFFINRSDLGDTFALRPSNTSKGILLSTLCSDIFTGRTPARKDYTKDGTKILKVRDLTGNGVKWHVDDHGFVDDDYTGKKIQKNDILIISSAHHPKYIGMKVDIVNYIPEKYSTTYCVTEIMVIRPDTKKIDPYDLLCLLKCGEGYDAIQSCIRGQTAHIYPKDISNIVLPQHRHYKKDLKELKIMLQTKTELEWSIHEKTQSLVGKF